MSALFHEYVVFGIFRVCNLAGFTLMMINVPLMQVQKVLKKIISKNHNNILFWIGFPIVGLPLCFLMFYYYNMRYTLFEEGGPLH